MDIGSGSPDSHTEIVHQATVFGLRRLLRFKKTQSIYPPDLIEGAAHDAFDIKVVPVVPHSAKQSACKGSRIT